MLLLNLNKENKMSKQKLDCVQTKNLSYGIYQHILKKINFCIARVIVDSKDRFFKGMLLGLEAAQYFNKRSGDKNV